MARIDIYNKNGDKVGSIGKGKNGKSAYQVALDNGFQGSEQDWLDSLKCADGIGVPIGGTTGQVLAKNSDENFDTAWVDEKGLENINLSSDKVSGILPESKGGTGTHSIIEAIQPYILNPNLLDNWYFADPINQRGQTEYINTVASHFQIIDRWAVNNLAHVSLQNGGMSFRKTGTYGTILCTIIENCPPAGETITLSALCKVNGGTFLLAFQDNAYNIVSIPITEEYTLVSITKKISGKLQWLGFRDISASNDSNNIHIKAAKLEIGDKQTLAHQDTEGNWVLNDPPPSQSLELLKCQRYFQVFETQAARPTKALDFRPTMRTEPTLSTSTVDSKTLYTASADL